jgi:beta-lactamase regulating signal transducer with metallopeptidase domain
MSTLPVDSVAWVALWIAVKASVLLAAAAIAQVVLRRTSAATRHLVWMLAIAGLLVLPVLTLTVPEWPVAVRTVAAPVVPPAPVLERVDTPADQAGPSILPSIPAASPSAAPSSADRSWWVVAAGVYAAGVGLMLIHLSVHRWRVRRLARKAAVVGSPDWTRLLSDCAGSLGVSRSVRLLRSRECSVPLAFGTIRPSILIPAVADTWSEDRRRAVVLHELAHIARWDCLTQTVAFAACAMYWFHPAVWWVARRLRIERELACDDRVLTMGTEPRDYAGHLLEIAYSFGRHRAPAVAVSMARPGQLEGRLRAALDRGRNRRVPAGRARLAGAAAAIALLLPLASATPTVVTAATSPERTPATPSPATAQPEILPPHLKAYHTEVGELLRRIEYAANVALGFVQGQPAGTWDLRPSSTKGAVHLRLVELNSSSGFTIPIERLEGLTAEQVATGAGPIQFRLRRDAGTFAFEGVLRNGVAGGTFAFTPEPRFVDELAKRGFARPSADEQYQLARHDVGYAFLDELNAQKYAKPQIAELVRAGQHGVQLTYLREMGALGYRLGSLDPLITLRDHGVTPDYVRELAENGYKGLSADELRVARDHGITGEYVRAMREAGYGSVPMDELRKARDHGVTPEFVRGLGDAGYRKLPLDQLIRVRDHGVSPEFAREMRQLGHALPIDELVRARDHGVDVEFVRAMTALGYGKRSMDTLVRMRDHGVTPEYARELKALGYEGLAADDLVSLRDHGVTPDRIRAANKRAGTRLPIEMLRSLAAGGMQ